MTKIYKEIGNGQYQDENYTIWNIFHDDHIMMCWYVVVLESRLKKKGGRKEINADVFGKAFDIRELPNYNILDDWMMFPCCTQGVVVPLIKEAVEKGYIKPC